MGIVHSIAGGLLALGALGACSSGPAEVPTDDPPEPPEVPLELAASYSLESIDGDPLPWTEPSPGSLVVVLTTGTVGVTAGTFKVRWSGYVWVCPTCGVLDRADSLYGLYQRTGPRSFAVEYTPGRIMHISVDETGGLFLREKVGFLGGIYEQAFQANP
jgi:hypothetical protein